MRLEHTSSNRAIYQKTFLPSHLHRCSVIDQTQQSQVAKEVYPTRTLEEFIIQHDSTFYENKEDSLINTNTTNGSHLRQLFRMAHINILNTFDTLEELNSHLEKLDITNQDRLRPKWDTYFMTLASLASLRSNCMKRRVGAILVRDRRILSTGYNGTPRNVRNCNEGGCKRCNSGVPSGQSLEDCVCLHAEENALLEAGRERVGVGCAIKIVQTGVKEVVYNLSYKVDDRTEALFKEAGVVLRQHSPPELE
ncbi:hypothetical protein Clacol_007763 [Clathrus columnatus]|uniref:Deoxycytidylate deaminase n=1 Tax=Clathrus columnatus TaxID=1419009 RepID=A0AAV5ALD2_9AGAM|nr:hypothetical protein Clacol_007763 [Clathrus columnatus]